MLKKAVKYVLDAMDIACDDTMGWSYVYSYDETTMMTGDVEINIKDIGTLFNINIILNDRNKRITLKLYNVWKGDVLLCTKDIKVDDDEWIERGVEEGNNDNVEEYLEEEINITVLDFINKMKEDKISGTLLDSAYYKDEHDILLKLSGLISKLRKVLPKDLKDNENEKQLEKLIAYFKNETLKK
ncbi:Hypothetical protein ORPV_948 [Orpheovirus IHUMI-LCC2]|uniref:Uncharacterized protein n=1 Tax=Orpheovirus IHUMI-LCC2 TaxID=2023057 RepID=A0A2I2L5M8_9VIRU|nr:Hypothetical protein ORPV_948 [Orpheovirus IHUMI-LCC2]SNW62852.1 Hypothetical protein ORPV_948 [Orpheovirus IHUMI-LCC2]